MVKDNKLRILHIIPSLAANGRTMLLLELITKTNMQFEHLVVTLNWGGTWKEKFYQENINIKQLVFNQHPMKLIKHRINVIKSIFRYNADICICWSGSANILSCIVKIFNIPIIWTIHNTIENWKRITNKIGIKISALLSMYIPDYIICCSQKTYRIYREIHKYNKKKLHIITNGVDTEKFKPNYQARKRIRKILNIPDNAIVVASSTRINEGLRKNTDGDFKDLPMLFEIIGIIEKNYQNIYFILFGSNIVHNNDTIKKLIKYNKIKYKIKLLGLIDNVNEIYAASDLIIFTSKSGEGLPLALIEGMSSGLIPVCTDSGDIRKVVGKSGYIIKFRDAKIFANTLIKISEKNSIERKEIALKARERVCKEYSSEGYINLFVELIYKITVAQNKQKSKQQFPVNLKGR